MESSSNSYCPLDISLISKSKIATEKDLEQEISKIAEVLKDSCNLNVVINIETYDWKKRSESLRKI